MNDRIDSRTTSRGLSLGAVHASSMAMLALLGALASPACIRERCYDNRECPSSQICSAAGACVFECEASRPCSSGFECIANRCTPRPAQPITCPGDMVSVADTFCVDKYEASRPDATATGWGRDEARAVSTAGVMPWSVLDNATAEAACNATGKRLCTGDEWRAACKGPHGTVYAYGDTYQPTVCNGIDAFGLQGFHLAPTGSFPGCTNGWGVFDMNGNIWEHVAGGSDMTVRGGAFNCSDSAALHKCDYVPGNWTPAARGFRCCLTPSGVDGGAADSGPDAPMGEGGACVSGGDSGPESLAMKDVGLDGNAEPDALDADMPDVTLAVDVPLGDDVPGPALDAGSDGQGPSCPAERAQVGEVCVDRWEASRDDATSTSAGKDVSVARSRPGVLPWYVNPMSSTALDAFQAACRAGGKRLCTSSEWLDTCRGPDRSTYFFGDDWDPAICNSVDTHCQKCCDILGLSDCPSGENCGYASALSSSYTPETCFVSADYGRDTCHVCYHVMPTHSFPRCTARGISDVNGNVWEVVTAPTSEDSRGYQVRGGAFNCGSPSARFRCEFNATWNDLYAGFRCCKDR